MHRRSMIILFTDMFQSDSADDNALFSALQHLRHNKHKVVLFHVVDTKTELKFDFDNTLESLSMWRPVKPFRFSDNVRRNMKNRPLCISKVSVKLCSK
jgi:hypothetical protein